MGTYQLPSSERLTYFCWILYRVSTYAPAEDGLDTLMSTPKTLEASVSLAITEKEESRKNLEEELKLHEKALKDADDLMRVVCSTVASPG